MKRELQRTACNNCGGLHVLVVYVDDREEL